MRSAGMCQTVFFRSNSSRVDGRDLLLLTFCGGVDAGNKQPLGFVALLSRVEKRHQRVFPKGEDVFLLQIAIAQLPELGAAFLDEEIESVAVGETIRLVLGFGVLAGEVGKRHG